MILHNQIKRKRPGLLPKKVAFHNNNARSHSAALPQGTILTVKKDIIKQPLYGVNLATSDFYIFELQKKDMSVLIFNLDEELEKWVK